MGHHLRTIYWMDAESIFGLAFLAIHHICYAVLFIYASYSALYGNFIQYDNSKAKAISIIWN